MRVYSVQILSIFSSFYAGFGFPYCQNGQYDPQSQRCDCDDNFHGEKCDKFCLYGNMDRERNKCVCIGDYFGESCDKYCVSGRLDPETERCKCSNNYYGVRCDSLCKNGYIEDGHCWCRPGFGGKSCHVCSSERWTGENCDRPVCEHEHGYLSSNACLCYHGYTGQFCHLISQSGVYHNCMNGKWSRVEEKCVCDAGWYGKSCSEERQTSDTETSYVTAAVLIGLCVLLPLSVIGYLFRKAFLQSRARDIESDREELLESAQIFTTSVNIPNTPPPTYEAGLEAPRPSTVFPETPPPSYEEATHPPLFALDRLL